MSDDTGNEDADFEMDGAMDEATGDGTDGVPDRSPDRTRPFLVVGGLLVVLALVLGVLLVLRDDDAGDSASDTTSDTTDDTVAGSGSPDTTGESVDEPAADDPPETSVELVELEISRGGDADERPRSFYRRLAESLSTGDLDFALERLDPAMDDLYGLDRCAATLQRLVDPDFDIRFFGVVRTEPWRFETNVGTVDIDETTVTEIALFGPRQDGERNESHLTILDGRYRWFTFC